jgi:hypothetical protein
MRPSIGAGISEETVEAHFRLLFDERVDEPEFHDKQISFREGSMMKDRIEDLAWEDALYPVTVLRQKLVLRFDRIGTSKTGGGFSSICAFEGLSDHARLANE